MDGYVADVERQLLAQLGRSGFSVGHLADGNLHLVVPLKPPAERAAVDAIMLTRGNRCEARLIDALLLDERGPHRAPPLQVLALQFQWGDEAAWPSDVGLLITLDDGDFPWIEPRLSDTPHGLGWVMRADDAGQVQFFGFDSPYDPLDFTLAVRTIDCAGVLSDPITLRIREPGSPLPEGDGASDPESAVSDGGCSLRATSTRTDATPRLLIGLCTLIAARRVRRVRYSVR